MPNVLPPGMRQETFNVALREFRAAIGDEWVFTSEDDLETYRDAYSIRRGHDDEYFASAAVAPIEVQQVQRIVRLANEYKIPLYPISTGKNLTYGGTAPTYSGSVVVDLKRMNKVLEVDEHRHFALVEPGCSYFDLYRHIQDRGLKVWIDCPDPGWGSPVGNALDRGVGYTSNAYRDHWGSHCGLEVVLPTGELMRTGMGGLPGAKSWQDYRYGVGPEVDGLFVQGNFGIVTKMGFWLMPEPEACLIGSISVPRYSDLEPLIQHVSYLLDTQILNGQPYYLSPLAAQSRSELQALLAKSWPTVAQLDALADSKNVPAWSVRLQFYGPEEVVRASWEYSKRRLGGAIPGASYSDPEILRMPLTPEQQRAHRIVEFGIPNLQTFSMMERRPGNPLKPPSGHSDFCSVVPRTANGLYEVGKALYETVKELGLPATVTPFPYPFSWHPRVFHLFAPTLFTYNDDPEQNRKVRVQYDTFLRRMAAAGFPNYRTNPNSQALLAQQFSFNNNSLLRFQEALKDAADPNGIMAPGRYGIWPKHLRTDRA